MYQVTDTKSIDKLCTHAVLKSTETSPVKNGKHTNKQQTTLTHSTMTKTKTADKASTKAKSTEIGLKETGRNRVSIAVGSVIDHTVVSF